MEVIEDKDIITDIPSGLLMDLNCIQEFREETLHNREVRMYMDRYPFLIESENILIAQYPKGASLGEGIIVHPRYANKRDFDMIEIKGYRNGRTIDILTMPHYKEGEWYNLINIKGVGAWTKDEPMVMNQESWYMLKEDKWVPFHEVMDRSLGRRWGMLDAYAGQLEYKNNLFSDNGLSQTPHMALNTMPEGILSFDGVTQLVRGLQTNIRCHEWDGHAFQRKYINPQDFSNIDAKVFEFQKRLFKDQKTVKFIGNIPSNRYIDGNFTDMENYSITNISNQEERLYYAMMFLGDIIGSAFVAMSQYEMGRAIYMENLEEATGMPLKKHISINPTIFLRFCMDKDEYLKKYGKESKHFHNTLKEDLIKYFMN